MMILLIILANNIEMTILFIFMFYFIDKISRKEKIKSPLETIKEKKRIKEEKREQEKEKQKLDIMLENINNYDGSSRNQKDLN